MAVIVTPGRLSQLSEFYHQLASMMSAGVTVMQALEQLRRSPPARSFSQPIQRILERLAQGVTFSEALALIPGWLPSFDLALIQAGEQSGRLDVCCRLLADYYRTRADLARRTISDLAYPVFLIHAAVLITPTLTLLFGGSVTTFFYQTAGILVPLYTVVFLVIFACQGQHGEQWRGAMERWLHGLPLIGIARRNLALARLAAALEALLSAGVPVIQAWELAADACGSPALRKGVIAWRPGLDSGSTPAELLGRSRDFPEMFANMYSTGEISGTLDETLKRLQRFYQEEGSRQIRAACQWAPRLVFLIIAAIIGYMIIKTYRGYIDEAMKVINF